MRTTGFSAMLLLCVLLPVAHGVGAEAPAAEITAEPAHHLALENEQVRVFQVEVAPQASTLLHRHGHDYLFVTLGDAHLSNEVEGKAAVELKLTDGETRFTPGSFAHVARNLADRPFRNVTIELMQDEHVRDAPSPWPPEIEGNREFPGGRIKVLFLRDGARVSELELRPGATVPSHHHDGPHLLVAVSDLELRSDVEGMEPMPGKFKAGDVKWLPGGYTHTLTNTGKSPARMVTVEFKELTGEGHAEVSEDPTLQGMKLLPGYKHIREQGIDSAVGKIVKGDRTVVQYDIGPMAGIHVSSADKKRCDVYQEKNVEGQTMRLCTKGNHFTVTFVEAGANFYGEAQDEQELFAVIQMLETFRGPHRVRPRK